LAMVADRSGLGEALEKKQSKAMPAARGKAVAGEIPIPIPTDSEPRLENVALPRLVSPNPMHALHCTRTPPLVCPNAVNIQRSCSSDYPAAPNHHRVLCWLFLFSGFFPQIVKWTPCLDLPCASFQLVIASALCL